MIVLYRLRNAETLELEAGVAPTSWIKRIVSGSKICNSLIERSHLAQLTRRVMVAMESVASPGTAGRPDLDQRLARALVRRMKSWCDRHDARFAVINNGWRSYDWLADVLRAEGVPFHDAAPLVQPALTADEASLTIPVDGHPNARGAAAIARAIWPFLVEFIREG